MDAVSRLFINNRTKGFAAQLQVGDEFGQALFQRLCVDQFAQAHLRAGLQRLADIAIQPRLVDDDLFVQRVRVAVILTDLQRDVGDFRLDGRAV